MCGIAAVINTSRKAKLVERGELKSMANAMIGRGPDAEGIWVSGDRGIGITCRRLSTQDPRALANQPAWNYDHSVVVVFNGEIYNHVEIRKELETRGYHFRTNNDAEVLANGFFAFGRHVLEKIRGQFSFVAFNRKNNEVLIARDPFGICPLYYTMHDEQLIVSSTVEAILKLERIPRKLDHQGVYDYLISNSMGWEKTFYKNISYLRSGFYLSFKRNEKPRKGRFYELSEGFFESNSGLSTEQWVEEIRHILFEAVKTSMLGDKEVGVYLSGGIDSVSIMSLIRRIFPDRVVKTFSAGFSHVMTGETVGEIDFARKMANHFNTIHHDVIVNENDILNDVGKFDTPPPNLINTIVKKMATMASENGVNVALSGEGSDEMFFGYDHFLAGIGFLNPEYNWMLKKYYLRGQYAASLDPETAEIVDVFRGGGADIDIDNNHDNLFTVNGSIRSVRSYIQTLVNEVFEANTESELDKYFMYIDYSQKIPEYCLRQNEGPSMGRGVEMRFPFLWYDLIALMYRMPMSIRIGDGTTKNILRKVMADILPPEILYRPKSPFALPATRERHYNGAELVFKKPALKCFFWKHYSRVAAALKDGKYQQENIFVDGLIENLLSKQEDFENAYFDHFLWKLWNIAEWYENWIAV